ncbi:hypothetical protein B0T18DRAFT_433523 [Schizothecium vesticola]|uniref:C2H2-type domain-containing protein n=1 Tax=Schizothecium vesticola TaxID=314040 RepID=A0AA40EG65_9PEZI|nr:hypothetical protein B0T18DRAFT_433523 [Schizothecium vesticola]
MEGTLTLREWSGPNTLRNQNLREKAPLAAQFEDCAQAVKQIHTAISADPESSAVQETSLRPMIERCLGRLTTWGHDTGASSRVLDHSLRRASKPRSNTMMLLKELHKLVLDAIESLPTAFEGAEGFGERPTEEFLEPPTSALASPPASSDHAEKQELEAILGVGNYDNGLNPEVYLAEAQEIIDDLSDLRSTLLDPYDDDDPESLPDTEHFAATDLQYAQNAFPPAASFLVDRLVAANRRRRRYISRLREDAGGIAGKPVATSRAPEAGDVVSAPSAPKSTRKIHSIARVQGYRRSARVSASEGASKTTPSTVGAETSLFSHEATHEKESISSCIPTDNGAIVPELQPPGPPVNLNDDKNIPFQCQYCQFEVPLELDKLHMALDDWVAHFYLDLQPYVCTYDGCSRAHKLFGHKHEWFQHELDYHRTHQAWYCANSGCEMEFETRPLFEQHLDSKHPEVIASDPTFLNIIIKNCQRLSVKSQPCPQTECPLCGAAYKEAVTDWKDHIAYHLEQFALLAIGEDDGPLLEEEENRDVRVASYVDEMKARFPSLPQGTTTGNAPATAIHSSLRPEESNNPHNLTDTSNEMAGSGGVEGRPHREREPLWENKVDEYITKQLEEDQVDSPEMVETTWLHVPSRNDEFVGRDNDLQRLGEFMCQTGHICVVSGRGGIGKTATAVEYARRYETHYGGVIWIEAETPGGLADKYNSIGTKLFTLDPESGQDSLSFTLTVRGMLEQWDRRWLLIFDNVESWEDIARYIPRGLPKTKGSVLITTRQQDLIKVDSRALQKVFHRIELEPLSPGEGGTFLVRSIHPHMAPEDICGHADYPLAVETAERVERLPLALIMVAGYAKVSRASLEDFLEIWDEKTAFRAKHAHRNALIDKEGLDRSIDLLWDIGINELSVPARNLLEILAFLDPENIQKDLLVGDHNEEFLEFLNSTEATQYRRMTRHLSGRKLIEVRGPEDGHAAAAGGGGESYRIHRLLQRKIILDVGAQLKFDSAMTKATRLVRKRFPRAPPTQAPAPQNKQRCKRYMAHAFSLLRAFNEAKEFFPGIEQTAELAGLFYDAGFYIWDCQATEHDGLAFLDAAESILDSVHVDAGPMDPRRADIHCMSGLLRNSMGCQERDESLRRLRLALDIRMHVYKQGPYTRDVDVLLQNAATDYAILLLNGYGLAKPEVIFGKCLEHYRAWGTEEEIPFEYSKYYYNMGVVHMCSGRMDEAIAFLRKSVDLVKAFNGKEGQYWDNTFMLACAFCATGNIEKALRKHLRSLTEKLEQLGKHSKRTILSTYAVGEMYGYIGDLPAAIDYMERCIELATASHWTEEALGRARLHLAYLYRRHGVNAEEADMLEAKAMEVLNKYRGFVTDWVLRSGEPLLMLDDLQPTDEGRYIGPSMLQVLWARREGRKTITFLRRLDDKEVTMKTGL